MIGDSKLNYTVDSGSKMMVVGNSKIPNDILAVNKDQQGKIAVLQSAFGHKIRDNVMLLSFKLRNGDNLMMQRRLTLFARLLTNLLMTLGVSLKYEDYKVEMSWNDFFQSHSLPFL